MANDLRNTGDSELFERLRGNGKEREAAFAELYNRHSRRVYLYCLRILGDEEHANDVFQETFLRLLQSANRVERIDNVPAYVLRIARNLCFDNKKRNARELVPIEELNIAVEDVTLESKELARLVALALDLLPENHREAFVLQTYNGLSYKEIADLMEVPMTSVRNWVVRAKRKIREVLSPYLEEYRSK